MNWSLVCKFTLYINDCKVMQWIHKKYGIECRCKSSIKMNSETNETENGFNPIKRNVPPKKTHSNQFVRLSSLWFHAK